MNGDNQRLLETLQTLRARLNELEQRFTTIDVGMSAQEVYDSVRRDAVTQLELALRHVQGSAAPASPDETPFPEAPSASAPAAPPPEPPPAAPEPAPLASVVPPAAPPASSAASGPQPAAPAAQPAPPPAPVAPPAQPGHASDPLAAPAEAAAPAPPQEISEMESLFGAASAAAPAAGPGDVTAAPAPTPFPEQTTGDIPARKDFPGAGDAPFRPVLIIKAKDKDRGEDTYELAEGQTLIGRAPENDIILLEESISRRHARIVVGNNEVSFEDLGSANGSFANGERLRPREPRTLHDNDVVKIGQLLALFRVNPDD